MKVNQFCSKVNLPKFCQKIGFNDYNFIRVPTFGWFAVSKDRKFIGNIFDLVDPNEQNRLYTTITKNHPDLLEFDLSYSEVTDAQIRSNLIEIKAWTAAYAFARKEMETFRVLYKGHKRPLRDVLSAHGLEGVVQNKVGVVTQKVVETFNMLPWPKQDIRGKLLVPSFCTPSHICSLEWASWNDWGSLNSLFLNDEKGWYGNIRKHHVLANIAEYTTTPGITWDYKADRWLDDEPTTMSEYLDIDTCLRVWKESRQAVFEKSPLEFLAESDKLGDLKNHIGNLSYNQVVTVEKATSQPLIEHWKQAREKQVQIGGNLFVKRDNRYYIHKKGILQEITNFAVEIDKIVKTEGKFFYQGTFYFGEKTEPFEVPEKMFRTNHLFNGGIRDKFMKAALGVPLIHPEFASRSLAIIMAFNAEVKVDLGIT